MKHRDGDVDYKRMKNRAEMADKLAEKESRMTLSAQCPSSFSPPSDSQHDICERQNFLTMKTIITRCLHNYQMFDGTKVMVAPNGFPGIGMRWYLGLLQLVCVP